MKRIVPIFLTLILIFALAVPAFAAENTYTLDGEWQFNSIISKPDWVELDSSPSTMRIQEVSCLRKYGGVEWEVCAGFFLGLSQYSDYYLGFLSESGYMSGKIPFGAEYSSNCYLRFDGPQTVSEEFYNWFLANATSLNCDGSCPFTDVDGDSYCDVCGGFFLPPPPGPLVEVMTQLKEQNQLSQVLTQVVMMIPIGLGCWVGYKGLRKALVVLRRILETA